jgi:hypothetical protein
MNNTVSETDKNGIAAAPRWKGTRSLELAHELNSRCVDLLCHSATRPHIDGLPVMLRANRNLWCQLNAEARWRLADFPFVIVDVRFRDDDWWRARGKIQDDAVAECFAADESLRESRQSLLLETLMFAWQVAREDSRVAQILFAMTPTVARVISALAMQDIRNLAINQSNCLRVRWDSDAQIWRDLLVAVATDDEAALHEVRLHAKLLFCGDLIAWDGKS